MLSSLSVTPFLFILLSSINLSRSSPTPQPPHLLILPTNSRFAASILSCATYHGRIGTSSVGGLYDLIHFPLGCGSSFQVERGEGAKFEMDWDMGEVVWTLGTEVDEDVEELRERRIGLAAAFSGGSAHGFLLQDGHRTEEHEVDELDGITLLAAFDIGTFFQINDYSVLERITSSPRFSLSKFVVISSVPLPLPRSLITPSTSSNPSFSSSSSSSPVSEPDRQRIISYQKNLKYSHLISNLIETLTIEQLEVDVKYLSGEDQAIAEGNENVTWVSRHSMSEGGHKASKWILGQMRSLGFNCSQYEYLPHFAPLVSCEIEGTDPNAGTFVLGGHFDSRGSFGYPTAPGADDDGSGTALLLSLSRVIASHHLSFTKKVRIVYFSGEEQGLLGSKAFAAKLKAEKEDVVLMVQVDMIAYRKPGEPIQMALPDLIGLDEAKWLLGNVSEIYVPELVVGETTACCSDHQSFEQNGFASTWVFERNGAISDPCYHNSCDLSARPGYDFEQVLATAKVVLATLLYVAGFSI